MSNYSYYTVYKINLLLYILGTLTFIGSGSFSACSKLSKVTLSNGLTILGTYMFNGGGVTEIVIPSNKCYIFIIINK